jgi:hypothetical protein
MQTEPSDPACHCCYILICLKEDFLPFKENSFKLELCGYTINHTVEYNFRVCSEQKFLPYLVKGIRFIQSQEKKADILRRRWYHPWQGSNPVLPDSERAVFGTVRLSLYGVKIV